MERRGKQSGTWETGACLSGQDVFIGALGIQLVGFGCGEVGDLVPQCGSWGDAPLGALAER